MNFKSFKIKLTLLISAFVLIICFVLVGTSVLKFEDLYTYMEELETNTVITGYKAGELSGVSENSAASTEEVNASVEEVNALMSSVSVTADNLSSEVENLYKQLDVFKL